LRQARKGSGTPHSYENRPPGSADLHTGAATMNLHNACLFYYINPAFFKSPILKTRQIILKKQGWQ
jgi:hypothetical protein